MTVTLLATTIVRYRDSFYFPFEMNPILKSKKVA